MLTSTEAGFSTMTSAEMLKEYLPNVMLGMTPTEGDPYIVLFCAADYSSKSLKCANHFLPVFALDTLEPGIAEKSEKLLQEELQQLNSIRCESSDDLAKKDPLQFTIALSKAKATKDRIRQIESFQAIQAQLKSFGYIAFEVPADGNCALHSILMLIKGPFQASLASEIASLRNEIADMWVEATACKRWTEVYLRMCAIFDDLSAPARRQRAEEKKKSTEERSPLPELVKKEAPEDEATPKKKNKGPPGRKRERDGKGTFGIRMYQAFFDHAWNIECLSYLVPLCF